MRRVVYGAVLLVLLLGANVTAESVEDEQPESGERSVSDQPSDDMPDDDDATPDPFEGLGLSEDDAITRLTAVFPLADTNGDGTIDKDELHTWLDLLSRKVMLRQAKFEMDVLDVDKNGSVDFDELVKGYANDETGSPNIRDEIQKRFDIVDADKNQRLDVDEMVALINPSTLEPLMDIEVDEVMANHDLDKDRKISLEEFVKDIEDESEKESMASEFRILDKNGDGFIDEAEVRIILMEPHKVDHEKVANDIYSGIHISVNQPITVDMVTKEAKFLISSAFTDNGELLRSPQDYDLNLPFGNVSPAGHQSAHDEL